MQIRSKIQHYWAETIERTSVVYGHHIKELEGDPIIINYFKVVLVGSSEVATVRRTHSHYFGLNHGDGPVLEDLNSSIVGFSNTMDIDVGAREILQTLERRRFLGSKSISKETLKNHFCKNILTFDSSFETLSEKELILLQSGVSLNLKKKKEIIGYL